MSEILLKNISKSFGKVEALKDISLNINDGEFIVFVGPSGCGKSTLLRSIAGLEEINQGTVSINGEEITHKHPSERNVAMVFQSYALFPHMTVAQNIEFGLKTKKVEKKIRNKKIQQAVSILQLENLLNRKPGQLSGGQRQRVAIGRAIVKEPKVFLFDEPLSNLDAKLRLQMRVELESLHKKLKATMIYVTHDQVEAMTMADRIVVLNHGCIEQFGPPMELYKKPQTKFVAGFIGSPSMNFLDVKLSKNKNNIEIHGEGIKIKMKKKIDFNPKEKYVMGIRPENLHHGKTNNHLSGKVVLVESLGGEAYVYIQLPQERVVYKTNSDIGLGFKMGSHIKLDADINQIHIFDVSGNNLSLINKK